MSHNKESAMVSLSGTLNTPQWILRYMPFRFPTSIPDNFILSEARLKGREVKFITAVFCVEFTVIFIYFCQWCNVSQYAKMYDRVVYANQ